MYEIIIENGKIIKNGDVSFDADDRNPLYQEYVAWLAQGNEPTEISVQSDDEFRLRDYVNDRIWSSKEPQDINFLTETNPPLMEVNIRNNGWLIERRYLGLDDNGQYSTLVVKMTIQWTHDNFGFVKTRTKRMYYVTRDGAEILLKLFPPQDVSGEAQRLGKERRSYLIDDLQSLILQEMVQIFSTLSAGEMVALGLTVPPISSQSFMIEVLEIGRAFMASLESAIVSYINNHTVQSLKSAIEGRAEAWLDKPSISMSGQTLRQMILSRLT